MKKETIPYIVMWEWSNVEIQTKFKPELVNEMFEKKKKLCRTNEIKHHPWQHKW